MPPKAFGLRWTFMGEKRVQGGVRNLWKARRTRIFDLVFNHQRKALYELGYSNDSYTTNGVAFWEKPEFDAKAARPIVVEAVVQTLITRRRIRLQTRDFRIERAKKEAAKKAELDARRGPALEGLKRVMRERFWAIHHSYIADATRLSQMVSLEDGDIARAEQIVTSTDKTVEKARASLSEQPPVDDRKFCQNPYVRDLVKDALRHITGNDEDWAALRNDIGWSKATTVVGHVLAMEEALTVEYAAHAMRILRVHHKQVPDDIRLALRIAA